MAGKGCALHHWVYDVVFNVSNQLVILTAYVLTRVNSILVGIIPIYIHLQSYLRTAISNFGLSLGRSSGSGWIIGLIPNLTNGTDNQEKDEKQSQNDKTGLGMEKTVKDKAKSKPESLEALGAIRTGFLGHSLRKSGLGSETTKIQGTDCPSGLRVICFTVNVYQGPVPSSRKGLPRFREPRIGTVIIDHKISRKKERFPLSRKLLGACVGVEIVRLASFKYHSGFGQSGRLVLSNCERGILG
ncbi:hypothetical protein Tco_0052738 [Tanacetum coccineum]